MNAVESQPGALLVGIACQLHVQEPLDKACVSPESSLARCVPSK